MIACSVTKDIHTNLQLHFYWPGYFNFLQPKPSAFQNQTLSIQLVKGYLKINCK